VSEHVAAAVAACERQDDAELAYPFGPQPAVYKIAGKIFAILSLDRDPQLISLKVDPEHGEALRAEHAAITPGYHLNKRHWISAALDGSLTQQLVEELIEDSYDLVKPRRRRGA
jgi:predicted DNA-binding protein (MmcQ/YjbR family)